MSQGNSQAYHIVAYEFAGQKRAKEVIDLIKQGGRANEYKVPAWAVMEVDDNGKTHIHQSGHGGIGTAIGTGAGALLGLVGGPAGLLVWTLGGALIVEALDQAAAGALQATRQPAEGVTYAHKIEKAEAAIDWALPAAQIERRVRAFDPFPGANFQRGADTIKVWQAECVAGEGEPGEVLATSADGIVVACGEGALRLTQLQRPGGKRAAARELLAALPIAVGERLGERIDGLAG